MAWIVVGETLLVRSAELEGLISIREDKEVHGRFGLALTVPRVAPPKGTLTLADTPFVHVPHDFVRSFRSYNSTSASSSDLGRVRSRMPPRILG